MVFVARVVYSDLDSCFGAQLMVLENEAITNLLTRDKKCKDNRAKTLANNAAKKNAKK